MPSLQDLQFQQGVGQNIADSAMKNQQANKYQEAAKQASDLYLKGDIQGASAVLMQADPALAGEILKPLSTTLNPKVQGDIQGAQTAGQLDAQMARGNDPRSLKLIDYQADLLKLQEAAKKELSNKAAKDQDQNDSWSMQAYTRVTASQPFKDFQEFKTRESAMQRALSDPSAYADIGAVFGFMKSLDPRSVVRESEYATASQAGSLLDKAKNYITKAEQGQILQPEQRQEIAQLAKHLGTVYKDNYTAALKPLYKQAAQRGVDVSNFDPYAVESMSPVEEGKGPKGTPVTGESTITSGTPKVAPGSIIIYSRKRYKVGADGDSLEEVK